VEGEFEVKNKYLPFAVIVLLLMTCLGGVGSVQAFSTFYACYPDGQPSLDDPPKHVFAEFEAIGVRGSGFPRGVLYVYVVDDNSWSGFGVIPQRVPGTRENFITDGYGWFDTYTVSCWDSNYGYYPGLPPGSYDIIIDVNRNGVYDPGVDAKDEVSVGENVPPPIHNPPVASFTYSPSNPLLKRQVTFDSSGSFDSDGKIAYLQWDFGDGTTSTFADPNARPTHVYLSEGRYTVKLTVTDNHLQTDSESQFLDVESLKAVIVDPFSFQNPNPDYISSVTKHLMDMGYEVQYVSSSNLGEKGMVEWLKTGLANKDLILWRGHVLTYVTPQGNIPCFYSSELVDTSIPDSYQEEINLQRVKTDSLDGFPGKEFFVITPKFIEDHYGNTLANSLIIAEGCRSFVDGDKNIMAEAFIGSGESKGTGAYVGFTTDIFLLNDFLGTGSDAVVEDFLSYLKADNSVDFAISEMNYKFDTSIKSYGSLTISEVAPDLSINRDFVSYPNAVTSSSIITNAAANHIDSTGVITKVSSSVTTSFVVSTINFGNNQPQETGLLPIGDSLFFDVKAIPDTYLESEDDTIATISFSDVTFNPNSIVSYWNGENWITLPTNFEGSSTLTCNIPISELSGTVFVVISENILVVPEYPIGPCLGLITFFAAMFVHKRKKLLNH
jgi:PKD repeat protein